MATSLRCRVPAISAFCRPTNQRHPPYITNCLVAIVDTNPVNSNFSPKIGCHGNVLSTAGPPSNTISTAHPSPQCKGHLDWFSRFCTGDRIMSLYFTMAAPFPLVSSHGRSRPSSNTWFPGPTRVLNPYGISIGQPFLQGWLVWQTDRQTDRLTDRQTALLGS